jgi:exopolysaccharide biosynthesis protein
VGDEVSFSLPSAWPVAEAMAGGPMLVQAGRVAIDRGVEDFAGSAPPLTFSRDETFDQNLLPRLAIGLHSSGDIICAAVDGRNLVHAPGLTLEATAALMVAAGCELALNLDGGSSKRMAVGGRVVDLSSTEVVLESGDSDAVRVVRSALLFH